MPVRQSLQNKKEELAFSIPQSVLVSGCKTVLPSTTSGDSRYNLESVQARFCKHNTTFTATDGKCLTTRQFEIGHGLEEEMTILIPKEQAKIIAATYNCPRKIDVCKNGNKIAIHAVKGNKKPKQIEVIPAVGHYPDWEQIVEDAFRGEKIGTIKGTAKDLKQLFTPRPYVTLLPGKIVGLENNFPADVAWEGDFEVNINPDLIHGFLSNLDGEKITIKLPSEKGRPITAISQCETIRYVQMPLVEDN